VVLFAAAVDGITYTLGREEIPKAVLDLYTTSESPLFFASVLLLAAPVFEEVFARGFMFRGIQASRLGNVGAVVLTSLVWSGIHLQYDWYHLLAVLAAGVLLGIARVRTRSLYTTIAMHSVWNLIATLEVWWYVHLCRLS
jgi:membrane protease YdiL (CAAX protease family)